MCYLIVNYRKTPQHPELYTYIEEALDHVTVEIFELGDFQHCYICSFHCPFFCSVTRKYQGSYTPAVNFMPLLAADPSALCMNS